MQSEFYFFFFFFCSLYRILSQKFSEERTWSSGHFPFGRTFPNRGNSKRRVYFAQLWTWVCILENAPFRVMNAIEFVYLLSWLRWIPLAILLSKLCTLKKILYLNPPKHELLNHLLIKSLNQPYYLVDFTKQCDFN